MEEEVNITLDSAIELLQEELERLTVALETCRRLDHPRRTELVRWHVRRVDQRQDALDKLMQAAGAATVAPAAADVVQAPRVNPAATAATPDAPPQTERTAPGDARTRGNLGSRERGER